MSKTLGEQTRPYTKPAPLTEIQPQSVNDTASTHPTGKSGKAKINAVESQGPHRLGQKGVKVEERNEMYLTRCRCKRSAWELSSFRAA
ncbi:hypothetical protein CDAR_391181 [Caerostris darwini]|uniref:Uncharacterized protein n=1 Tax=Caerostris darwini TaxID=1538125 RepID=A0AAV4SUH7_9ARAC|nr:hypothetical protein CDAR_391181 [Caerostris darwini]